LAREFYPELFVEGSCSSKEEIAERFLFDGSVLVFWRGYSREVTRGRLLLPKIDYLQASLVQRLSGSVKKKLDVWDRYLTIKSLTMYRKAMDCFLSTCT
jgi:hypothetical protein